MRFVLDTFLGNAGDFLATTFFAATFLVGALATGFFGTDFFTGAALVVADFGFVTAGVFLTLGGLVF